MLCICLPVVFGIFLCLPKRFSLKAVLQSLPSFQCF